MADQHSIEDSNMNDGSGERSESMVELNVKTLESQIYSFQVDKNMAVSLLKEKIASQIGLPVGQQRLIFRGKVLKDDHLLSEYHVENGHTLHLVARQPSESPPPSSMNSGETSSNTGLDSNAAGSRNRIGQISHSVVLGTLNVGDQGEGVVPDISRVIGAVLNSIGIGNLNPANVIGGVHPNVQFNTSVQAPQGNEVNGTRNNAGAQSHAGAQAQPGQASPNQSLPQVLQIPMGATVPLPSLNVPIPDSLHTLSEFMNRMELALSQNGYLRNQSPTDNGDLPTMELPSNARGLSTPEALIIVLRHAQRLLSGHAVAALSHIAGRLEQDGGSTDPTVRSQIMTESVQVGLAMQHFGALLLELGRTIMTLRMGQSLEESLVNAGPAVYISPSGPNPIMVQPFPLQTNSLFGGSIAGPSNAGTYGPVGIGTIPRNVNIHIHAVGPRASNTDGVQGERANQTSSGDPGQTRVLPVRNVIAAAFPSRQSATVYSSSQTGVSVSQPPPDSAQLSTVISEVNSRIRNFVDNMRSENEAPPGHAESSTVQNPSVGPAVRNMEGNNQLRSLADNEEVTRTGVNSKDVSSSSSVGGSHSHSNRETRLNSMDNLESMDNSESAPRSGQGNDNPDGAPAVPLGLGLGGLQPKRVSSRQSRSQGKVSDGDSSGAPSQNQQARTNGQKVLQSLASLAARRNTNAPSSGQVPPALGHMIESIQTGGGGADGQVNPASVMSQVLHSPAFNGLLTGVSEQAGVGSPDVLRNMLQQFTQSPAMMNTVNQMAQQFDGQDLGNMLSGFGRGQGGGVDLTSMVQQMMPLVSQALSGGSIIPQPRSAARSEPQTHFHERSLRRDEKANDQDTQIDLQQVVQRIEQQSSSEEIFRSVADSAARLYDGGSDVDIVNELSSEGGLAREFLEVLRRDLRQRLEGEEESQEMS